MIARYALIFPWIVFAVVWTIAAPFTQKTVRRESMFSRGAYLLPILFAIVALETRVLVAIWPGFYARIVPDTPAIRMIAYAFDYGGIAFSIWARATLGSLWSGTITLKENHRLVQAGPFSITRHPIYTGIVLAAVGIVLRVGTPFALVGLAVLVASFVKKLGKEEALMRETFGDEHRAYAERVRKLVPYIW